MSAAAGALADPGKESRAASGIPVVAAFDGYRAYAILGIVWLHVLSAAGIFADVGSGPSYRLLQATLGQCIDVLFIISGFVVFLPTVARGGEFGSVRSFAIRRAARLVPAYWAILAIALVLIAAVPLEPAVAMPGIGAVLAHFAFLHTPVTLFHPVAMGFGVDGPVWTLSLEVTFYLLLPLVASWYFRRPLLGLAIAALITLAWHEGIIHFDGVASFFGFDPSPSTAFRMHVVTLTQFPFWAFSFAAGMTSAWAYVRARERWTPASLARGAAVVQVVSLALLVLFGLLLSRHADGLRFGAELGRRPPLVAIGFSGSLTALMVATSLGSRRWQRPFAHPLARRLGDISYGIYLVHFLIITFVLGPASIAPGDGSVGDLLLVAAIVFPLSILYGYLSARFVEQPIRRWARRYGARRQEVAAHELPTAGAVS